MQYIAQLSGINNVTTRILLSIRPYVKHVLKHIRHKDRYNNNVAKDHPTKKAVSNIIETAFKIQRHTTDPSAGTYNQRQLQEDAINTVPMVPAHCTYLTHPAPYYPARH